LVVRVVGQRNTFQTAKTIARLRQGLQGLVTGNSGRLFRALAGFVARVSLQGPQLNIQALAKRNASLLKRHTRRLKVVIDV
jgi:hypothetical protein